MKLFNPVHLRRLVPAALLAAAATVGASAAGDPATAYAVPEWDIGAYDQCVASFDGSPSTSDADYKRWQDHMKLCCEKTGGVYSYPGAGGCTAPPAEPADAQQGPGRLPGVVATQTLAPAPPPIRNPGVVTQTFAPAPASPG